MLDLIRYQNMFLASLLVLVVVKDERIDNYLLETVGPLFLRSIKTTLPGREFGWGGTFNKR